MSKAIADMTEDEVVEFLDTIDNSGVFLDKERTIFISPIGVSRMRVFLEQHKAQQEQLSFVHDIGEIAQEGENAAES